MAKAKTTTFATNIQVVATTTFKLSALAYAIGLCGAFENGTLTGKEFAVKITIAMLVMFFG